MTRYGGGTAPFCDPSSRAGAGRGKPGGGGDRTGGAAICATGGIEGARRSRKGCSNWPRRLSAPGKIELIVAPALLDRMVKGRRSGCCKKGWRQRAWRCTHWAVYRARMCAKRRWLSAPGSELLHGKTGSQSGWRCAVRPTSASRCAAIANKSNLAGKSPSLP